MTSVRVVLMYQDYAARLDSIRIAPDVPTVNATRSRDTQPTPMLFAAPSPMA